ncbi:MULTISPECIES: hypothetical protein [unclassified Kitasatospora]
MAESTARDARAHGCGTQRPYWTAALAESATRRSTQRGSAEDAPTLIDGLLAH